MVSASPPPPPQSVIIPLWVKSSLNYGIVQAFYKYMKKRWYVAPGVRYNHRYYHNLCSISSIMFFGSGTLPGKMLLERIIENNIIDVLLRSC